LIVKLISKKKYNELKQVIDVEGYTVWLVKQGRVSPITCSTIKEAAKLCVSD
jgi:type III restriction enzyme